MAIGETGDLYKMSKADSSFEPSLTYASFGIAEIGVVSLFSHHTANLSYWMRRVGDVIGEGRFRGQCAVLVQYATQDSVGRTRTWIQGPKVKSNDAIPGGTAIASGWINGRYPGRKEGNTAAIFLKGHKDGTFKCLHQWVNRNGQATGIKVDHIPLLGSHYIAESFNVILTVRRINFIKPEEQIAESGPPLGSIWS